MNILKITKNMNGEVVLILPDGKTHSFSDEEEACDAATSWCQQEHLKTSKEGKRFIGIIDLS